MQSVIKHIIKQGGERVYKNKTKQNTFLSHKHRQTDWQYSQPTKTYHFQIL